LRDRDPLPFEKEKLDAEPEMDQAMLMCIAAWNDLTSERPLGFGAAGYIPWSSIMAWCEHEGLDTELTVFVKDVLRILDLDRADRLASKKPPPKAKR
jgi:hypothetical protein